MNFCTSQGAMSYKYKWSFSPLFHFTALCSSKTNYAFPHPQTSNGSPASAFVDNISSDLPTFPSHDHFFPQSKLNYKLLHEDFSDSSKQ